MREFNFFAISNLQDYKHIIRWQTAKHHEPDAVCVSFCLPAALKANRRSFSHKNKMNFSSKTIKGLLNVWTQ